MQLWTLGIKPLSEPQLSQLTVSITMKPNPQSSIYSSSSGIMTSLVCYKTQCTIFAPEDINYASELTFSPAPFLQILYTISLEVPIQLQPFGTQKDADSVRSKDLPPNKNKWIGQSGPSYSFPKLINHMVLTNNFHVKIMFRQIDRHLTVFRTKVPSEHPICHICVRPCL